MQFEGAVITEQGVTFAIVIVKPYLLDSSSQREDTRSGFSNVFPRIPIIPMAQDARGRATYHGRPDIVQFLARISPSRIPWKRYTLN